MKINSFFLFALLIFILAGSINFISIESGSENKFVKTSSVTICEQFAGATFPPTGWSVTGNGASFWSRVTQSGFGVGTGSAKFDMWNAANGVIGNLITPVFDATQAGDSLAIDVAFCPFNNADSLFLMASTDAGATYTRIVDIIENWPSPPGGCSPPFAPANGWIKKMYALPTGTNKINFMGKSGFGDNAYLDSICIKAGVNGIIHNFYNIPNEYSLFQNYPNPFNPSTVISFGIPKAGNVKLIVYDNLGREVEILVDDFKSAGAYDISFDASSLASGIYFYKLETQDFTETKKMLLIK